MLYFIKFIERSILVIIFFEKHLTFDNRLKMDKKFVNVLLLGFGFMFLFTAFQTMGNIEVNIHSFISLNGIELIILNQQVAKYPDDFFELTRKRIINKKVVNERIKLIK